MANKTLTAKVKLDTNSAEASLNRLAKKINNVQSAINKTSRKSGLEQSVNRTVLAQERLKQATLRTQLAEEKLTAQKHKTALAAQKVKDATEKSASSATKLSNAFRSGNSHANGLLTTVKRLAATYLGIMGMKAIISTSDSITSTQNKLNNLNNGDTDLTQLQMDKMYASANRVRMSYTDMLANASKSMVLAGDAFQGNIDNAIRFQEIMAETYALGGATAPEMSTSMYQMIQALGAGTLAGDELRSVREGAPLAYKAIEEFAQGIYKTEKSLKDLAAQGMITSDIVVAAIMKAGYDIDEQFKKTSMTFGQAWNRIKNSAVKAFEPVSKMLNEMLNRAAENGAFEKIEDAFWSISKVIQIVFKVIERTVDWIIDNWDTVKNIIVAGLLVLAGMWTYQATMAVRSCAKKIMALSAVNASIMVIVAGVMALIYVFYLWKTGAIDTCEAIAYAIMIVGAVLAVVLAIATGGLTFLIGLIIAAIGAVVLFFAEICGWVMVSFTAAVNRVQLVLNYILAGLVWFGATFRNGVAVIVNTILGALTWALSAFLNFTMSIGNGATAIFNVIKAICNNIGIAFKNCWIFAQNSFWSFIENVLTGISALADVIDAIAEALGVEGFSMESVISTVGGNHQEYIPYQDIGDAWESGMNTYSTLDLGDAWDFGSSILDYTNVDDAVNGAMNTFSPFQDGWVSDAYNAGYEWGAGIESIVNDWGSQFQTGLFGDGAGSILDNIGNALGLNFDDLGSGFPGAFDPAYDINGAYSQPEDLLSGIADDVHDIKDSVELSQEDLDYLRKLAEMEWQKEYTSNNITIDMTNYNSVSGENDLDGIVTTLVTKLSEELNVMAEGVYA